MNGETPWGAPFLDPDKYYTDILNQSTTDLETLKDVIQSVSSSTDVSTDAAIAQLIGVALLTGGLAA